MKDNTLTAELILQEVEQYVNDEVSFIDALVHFSHKYDIELELIGDIVRRSVLLKAKVRNDAEKLNFMKEKTATLPV